MLTTSLVLCDYSERAAPELMSRPLLGGFLKGGVCATLGWVVAWPLKVAKNRAPRGRAPGGPRARSCAGWCGARAPLGCSAASCPARCGPSSFFVVNGVGMAVFQLTQSMRTDQQEEGQGQQ